MGTNQHVCELVQREKINNELIKKNLRKDINKMVNVLFDGDSKEAGDRRAFKQKINTIGKSYMIDGWFIIIH